DPQRPLAPPELDARDVDARQVGVPVVRRVGSRVPVRAVCAGRREVRQGPAVGAALRAVPASERAAAGIRVGVWRSEPAGPRVGAARRLWGGCVRFAPPPVHAWAVWRVFNMDRIRNGHADREWLERCFHKLLINFASWVNKVDRDGNNVFEGGFLGLDNITVVDRSEFGRGESGPGSAVLEQSDATGWMGMFCLNLMRIALELARENPVYEGLASKFLQHYVYVAHAMKHMGERDAPLFDPEAGFFYDVLRHADGSSQKFRVRSLVGLIPLFAVERLEVEWIEPFKEFTANLTWFLKNRRHLVEEVIHPLERADGKTTYLLTIVNTAQLVHLLGYTHDEREFLSRYGIRSLSRLHEAEPFEWAGHRVAYEPAESAVKLKGGNSNWRGPIWFPTTFLIIES